MNPLRRRLERLEGEIGGGAGRVLVVSSGGATEQEVADMLARDHGITVRPVDTLVHFVTIYENEDGSAAPNQRPPVYTPMRQPGTLRRAQP